MPITDDEIEKAVDYLRDNATVAAQARANRVYMEEYRKSVKAQLMQHKTLDSIGAQERYAYAHPEYLAHLEALKAAVFEDEKHRFLLEAAKAKLDAWRTQEATGRALRV